MSLRFKGISSQNYFIVEKIYRSLLPPVSHNGIKVPGKPGMEIQNTELGVRTITAVIRIRENSIDDLNATINNIAGWLYSEENEELILEKEPDKYYLAKLEGETDLEEIVRIGKGQITFICSDPIAFDRNEVFVPISSGSASTSIEVGGTYKTFPIVRATFKQPSTFFSYATDKENEQVMIGTPVNEAEQEAVPAEELVLYETGDNLTGWSSDGTIVDDGAISGSMQSDSGRITYSSLGTGTAWHGPAIKKALPELLDNWRVDFWVKFKTISPYEMGKIELYLLDVNGNPIHLLGMRDSFYGLEDTYGRVRIGTKFNGHDMINTHGIRPGLWNDFYGLIRLEKEGNFFRAYIGRAEPPDYKHHTRWNATWLDVKGLYTPAVAQIGLYIAGFGTRPAPAVNDVHLDVLRVYKKNILAENQIEYLAEAGDELEINHYTKEILKNGEPFKKRLSPISKLFPLSVGTNNIGFFPNDVADIDVSYRNRWL